jgi:8-amino-7-oxononanoate synthase
MANEDWIAGELDQLRARGLERSLRAFESTGGRVRLGPRTLLNFSSNDYLDLANHPRVKASAQAAIDAYGSGATASRLVSGTLRLHEELETRLASLKGYPSSLVFASGYLANAGAIACLVGEDDLVIADKFAHASILDAVALSGARLARFRHNDPGHLAEVLEREPAKRRRLVATESVFSMDGDLAPLADLCALAHARDAMVLVDEAHASGVFGPGGSGLVSSLGLQDRVNVSMFTLSKAFGSFGGAVACSARLREWLVNRARSFIYTTALPPASVGAALGALDVLAQQHGLGAELLRRSSQFRERLKAAGLDTLWSESQIVPVKIGDNEKALALSRRLLDADILAVAIRPPTVPQGTARIRFSVTLAHTEEDLAAAAAAIVEAFRAEELL